MPLRRAIELLEVSVSVFYKWLNDDYKEHRNGVIYRKAELVVEIKEVIKESNNTVPGALRVYFEWNKL